ncbi:2260_t:CDS:1, partial [Ambispora leptoticha]
MPLELPGSKASMYNANAWGVITVQLPVVAVQFHVQCVQIVRPGIFVYCTVHY